MLYCVWLSPEQTPPPNSLPPLGGKAATLAHLAQAHFPVLPGVVLLPQAFWASLPLDHRDALTLTNDHIPTHIAPAVIAEVRRCLKAIEAPEQRWAVRSSALAEDGTQQSYAGQLETVLGVALADLESAILKVWQSAFSESLQAYRQAQDSPNSETSDTEVSSLQTSATSTHLQPPAVLIQLMLNPVAAGVAFSADPISGRRGVTVIQAVYGLSAALVNGDVVGDTYLVSREGQILERRLALQTQQQRIDTSGNLTWEPVPAEAQQRAVLTDSQILDIAQLAQKISHHQSRPQDIEWAWVEEPPHPPTPSPTRGEGEPETFQSPSPNLGEGFRVRAANLYLLQARPITTLATQPDPDGTYGLWDNSNIVESYSGVTTPLTFSFARKAYTEVYQQFCRFMGVPDGVIAQHRQVFQTMIGFLQGRIYYNLLSWYRVLTFLPGYRLNARFLEQMLGVQQGLPDAVMADIRRQNQTHPAADALRLAWSTGRILTNYATLNRRIQRYHQRLGRVLMTADQLATLPDQRPDELVKIYRRIEGELLTHWDAPLINDFFAMIFYGVLKKLVTRWYDDTTGALQNTLISLTGDIISTEPAQRITEMAAMLADYPESINVFCNGSLAEIQRTLKTIPPLAAAYQQYLAKFGDRCLEELKLESPTLSDDPLPLLRTVGYMAQKKPSPPQSPSPQGRGGGRTENTHCSNDLLPSNSPLPVGEGPGVRAKDLEVRAKVLGVRAILFRWVLHNTRRLVRNRENLRFERTRVFGQARRVFVELGKRFYALDWLDDPADIFFLEVEEIMGLVEGTATTLDLRGLVSVRQAQYQQHLAAPALPRRLETFGLPSLGLSSPSVPSFEAELSTDLGISQVTDSNDTWQGTGCAPGMVQGRVCLVSHPRQWLQRQGAPKENQEPQILVATSTDPGWVLLFPHAQGLLVERGSVLSHVAIVARELGLPMVSDLPNVTTLLKEGDWVAVDGRTGRVQRISPES
ncbi:phosphoenolpyruvate synthase [Leptolyngbya sp. BL0902]|uniref:PEP/pyruvate-binding domain-containing protein n=1 Tax=Leptolyngbya sp. BL0902 TaxID=1115757 RepID=UPI0018E8A172|nr:PEP/pyruvate-binding domain-containing protein [Leptolyngbya sp. BL0902]QQE67230.1 phosphoenolpyruvate synthase [Leptolyngbya sp. BL0902]